MPDVISASEFKAKCLKLMDEVEATGRPLTITKNGRPVARLVAAGPRRAVVGLHQGRGRILGDIVGPLEPDGYEPFEGDPALVKKE